MVTPSKVTVVLLNYRGADDTVRCLRSLYAMHEPPGRVIVVDNNSEDASIDIILKAWRSLGCSAVLCREVGGACPSTNVMLCLSENDGYSAGNNAGIRIALQDVQCRAVWILNNDTEIDTFALNALCACLNMNPDSGMCGSTVVRFHDRKIVQCAGGYSFSNMLGTTPAVCGEISLERVLSLDPVRVAASIKYLSGASLLVRREVFERMGLFDEAYFLYYEDAEFGLRAGQHGYGLSWAPASIVYHKEGGTTGVSSAVHRPKYIDYLALRNRMYTLRRYSPCLLPIAVASYFGVMLKRVARGAGGSYPAGVLGSLAWLGRSVGAPRFPVSFHASARASCLSSSRLRRWSRTPLAITPILA